MAKKTSPNSNSEPRWMTQCDVMKYNLQIPQDLKQQLKKEALERNIDMSAYICGLLSGDLKRKKAKK
jgi:hypothetical protein